MEAFPEAKLSFDSGGLSTLVPPVQKEENGIRRVPAWNPGILSVVDPRFTVAGKNGGEPVHSSALQSPWKEVYSRWKPIIRSEPLL